MTLVQWLVVLLLLVLLLQLLLLLLLLVQLLLKNCGLDLLLMRTHAHTDV